MIDYWIAKFGFFFKTQGEVGINQDEGFQSDSHKNWW